MLDLFRSFEWWVFKVGFPELISQLIFSDSFVGGILDHESINRYQLGICSFVLFNQNTTAHTTLRLLFKQNNLDWIDFLFLLIGLQQTTSYLKTQLM